ncbi:MAG: SIMPL domain-containing protein [Steroidobacteraceae bacterium]
MSAIWRESKPVDAALGAGATSVSEVEFGLRDEAPARRRALTEAVDNARRDAPRPSLRRRAVHWEACCVWARAVLPATWRDDGMLEEVVVTASFRGRDHQTYATKIEETDVRIKARVVGRWQFIPAAR